MNLLCPNCNKMLTVPEQYAGQLMKCPLCSGTFTVPNMPAFGGPELAPAFDAPSPPAPPPQPETYGVQPDAAPAFQASPPAPEPAFSVTPPSPPAAPPPSRATSSAPATTPPTVPAGYTTRLTAVVSDRVLQWVPPGCIVLIFFLLFFPWVGVYPGGVAATTQTAWGAAFGGYTQDKDMKSEFSFLDTRELDDKNKERRDQKKDELKDYRPGWAILILFYLFPFFFLTLAVSGALVALNFVHINLPPVAQQLLPWKWAILFGLNAVLLLFLTMQLLLGFPIEANYRALVKDDPSIQKDTNTTQEEKKAEAAYGKLMAWLHRTTVLRLVVLLHVVATVCAGLVYWVERRGPGKPLPRVELMW